MTIENTLERIATALETIAASGALPQVVPVVETPQVAAPVVPPMPAPPMAPETTAPANPVAPVLEIPQTLESPAPFSDGPGLIKYVTESYQQMGPEKGGRIQDELSKLGYSNINDVIKDHYVVLYRAIEAIKAGG